MKKRNIIVCSICIVLVITLIALLSSNKRNTFISNGVTYALTVDGVKQNSFPTKGMYRVDTECTNATCKWDYDTWKLYIEDITGDVFCNISFTTITKNNLNNYIISLSGTNLGTVQVVNENGYRYEGQDPNNYVWFNNELWRIIGVFDARSHGVSNTKLVKIIRKESIGGLVWNAWTGNNWDTATLKELLNTEYLNSQNGTNRGNCYGYFTTSKVKCDYTTSGIKNNYGGMIKEVTWYLGGHSDSNITAEEIYGYERDASKIYGSNPSNINAKVGLMYASDYGYAVPELNCARTTSLSSYNNENCTLNNWLYIAESQWTISPAASNRMIYYMNSNGSIYPSLEGYGCAVRPTLYLNENVYVLDGDGSITDPYIIAMDEV